MRVPPSGFKPLQPNESSPLKSEKSLPKAAFDSHIAQVKTVAPAQAAADLIDDVKALAAAFKSGAVSKEEVSARFVSLVIEKRHDLSALGPKQKLIEDSVKEIAGDDPHFVSKLQSQLQKLA